MEKRSEPQDEQQTLRQKIIGLGDRSSRKSYYPQLQQQLHELEEHKSRLEERSEALMATLEQLEASRKTVEESEKKFRALFEQVSDGILLVELQSGQCSMGNNMFCHMLGYRKEELSALPIWALFPEEEQPKILHSFKEQDRFGYLLTNIIVKRKEASTFYADINTSSIRLGENVFWMGVFRDVSERRQAEEKIRLLNAELEHRVEERTVELRAVNSELREFASVVSHDLKSPLRGIKQLASWLIEDYNDCFDRDGKEMIQLLMDRVRHMDTLIDGILKYSRAGRVLGAKEDIDIARLLDTIVDVLAPPESISIVMKPPLPNVLADRMRLVQVFQNLLENAIKFMDKPKGEIVISCLDRERHWQFCVADNGPGIELEEQKKIFQIFQRMKKHDTKEGTGIGLALVKKIIEAGGGNLWLQSRPGEGCQFYFTLNKGEVNYEES